MLYLRCIDYINQNLILDLKGNLIAFGVELGEWICQ